MSSKKVIAIFDFCETLVDHQTADKFVLFILSKKYNVRAWLIEWLRQILNKARLISGFTNKRLHLLKLKGMQADRLLTYASAYVNEKLITGEIPEIKERLNWHRQNGHIIVLVSGGYTDYLNVYGEYIHADVVVGTDIDIMDQTLTGKIKGLNCLAENKVIKLAQAVDLNLYDLENSYCYSDSLTDLPIMMMVGKRFLVSKNTPHETDWVKYLNIQTITIH